MSPRSLKNLLKDSPEDRKKYVTKETPKLSLDFTHQHHVQPQDLVCFMSFKNNSSRTN